MDSTTDANKENKFTRHSAIKVAIKTVSTGQFSQVDDQSPSYLLTKEGRKLFRVNLMATIVEKEILGSITNMLIDDGTEKVILRSFEGSKQISNLNVGDVVVCIGKVRVYNKEKYISPEIVRKVSPLWLKVRFLELGPLGAKVEAENVGKDLDKPKLEKIEEESQKVEEISLLPVEKLSKLISELDKGNGVLIEEIIEKSPLDKTEELIQKMLENGDVFKNSPGKIKVL